MNALALYVSTCRLVLQSQLDDAGVWSQLGRLLPQLRKALSCAVCAKLVEEPMGPNERSCPHSVCRECLGKKVRPRSLCSLCKDHRTFVENEQVTTLLLCFRKVCEYLVRSYRKVHNREPASNLYQFLRECIGLKDIPTDRKTNGNLPLDTDDQLLRELPSNGNECISGHTNMYSVMFANDHRTKITIKRKQIDSSISSDSNGESVKTVKRVKAKEVSRNKTIRNKLPVKKGCRCGCATPTPGKLTCCGQRCPCYVNGKNCSECKCRGCRNPHKLTKNLGQSEVALPPADDKTTDTGSDIDIFDIVGN